MIFTPANCQAILEGKKTQTRRPWKEGDHLVTAFLRDVANPHHVQFIFDEHGHKRWVTHQSYALQPGRGKKGITRIRFTHFELQYLQDTTDDDAIAEGIYSFETESGLYYAAPGIGIVAPTPCLAYQGEWDCLYEGQPKLLWATNPRVWVLHLELA